jgi:hypothetical protein
MAAKKAKKWSKKIKTSWEPPEGLFKQDPKTIAYAVASDSKDLRQAVQRIQFYVNRAGSNLSTERKRTMDRAKDYVRFLFDNPSSLAQVRRSSIAPSSTFLSLA